MTRKERFLAAMRFQPVDRIPWSPKMLFSYYLKGQDSRWRSLSWPELADYLGIEMMVFASPGSFSYDDPVDVRTECASDRVTTLYSTPLGTLRTSLSYSHEAQEWHPVEPLLKGEADYDVFRFVLDHRRFEPDSEPYLEAERTVGDRGVVFVMGPATPFMQLLQYEINMPYIYYQLQDHPEQLQSLLGQMAELNCSFYRQIAEHNPSQYVVIGENTSITQTSPAVYRQHCQPVLRRYAEVIRTAGKLPMVHMCGHLLDLLPDIAELGVAAVEAFSSPPVGDTHLADGTKAFGRTTAIIGGLNAALLDQMPLRDLCWWLENELAHLPERTGVVLTSGGVLPPGCTVDRLKSITEAFKPLLSAN